MTATAFLLVVVAGAAAALVVRAARADDPCLDAVTAIAIAVGLVSVGATARLLFGVVGLLAWAGGVAVLAVPWARAGARALPPRPANPTAPAGKAVLALFVVAVAAWAFVVVARAARVPDGEWDAVGFWNLRARLFHRAPDLATVFSTEMPGSHPDYPLLLPGAIAWGEMLAGDGSGLPSAAIALLFGALAVVALFAGVRSARGTTAACLATTALLAAPHFARQVSWRYADVPLAALVLLASARLVAAHEQPEVARSSLALAGVCASLAAWTKNEGVVHLLAFALVVVLLPPPGTTRRGALARFAAGAAPFVLLLVAFKATLAPPNDLVSESTPAGLLARGVDPARWLAVGREIALEAVRTSHWNLLLPAAVLVAVLGRTRTRGTRALGLWLGLVALAYVGVYVLTPKDLAFHLRTSFERLVMHLYPALLLLAAVRAAPAPTGELSGAAVLAQPGG